MWIRCTSRVRQNKVKWGAKALKKSGKLNELFRAQLKARRISEHTLKSAICTLRGSEIVLDVVRESARRHGPFVLVNLQWGADDVKQR